KSRGIAVNVKAAAPERLTVAETDLCTVIGNLLDNAAEACEKLPDPQQRFVRLYLGTLKGQLYLSVTNSCPGTPRPISGRYPTQKPGMHGLGLTRIDRIVSKYNGFLNRQSEEGVFATEILLPL
ncbi:MAG: ATP-binding protein, partial [Candidatus Spyradocola sp.]